MENEWVPAFCIQIKIYLIELKNWAITEVKHVIAET